MRTQTSHFLIGIFVLSGTALLVVALVLLAASTPRQERVLAETTFDESVAGLEKGAAVRFLGVKMGEVDAVAIAGAVYDTQQSSVVVRFHVTPPPQARYGADRLREIMRARVREGVRVRLASSGLTGLTYLDANLFPDTDRYPIKQRDWVKEGDPEPYVYIPSIPSQLTRLADSLEALLANASKADLATLVNEASTTVKELNTTLGKAGVAELREEATQALRAARQLIQALDKDVPPLVASLERASTRIDSAATQLDGLLGDPRLRGTLQNLQDLSAAAAPVLVDARSLIQDGRSVLEGRSRDLAVIFENLRAASDHLRNLSATADRYPSFLLFGTPPPEIRTTR